MSNPLSFNGEYLPLVMCSSLTTIKGSEGSLVKGLPILSERGIPLRLRVLFGVLGFLLGFSSWVSFRVSMLLCVLIRLGFLVVVLVRPMRPRL